MKKSCFSILCFFLAVCCVSAAASSDTGNEVSVYFFWGDGCPHCEREKAFLKELEQKYPKLKITSLEVWYDAGNAELLSEMAAAYGKKRVGGVPALFIGDFEPIVGYLNDWITGSAIEERIKGCIESGCINPISKLGRSVQEKEASAPKAPEAAVESETPGKEKETGSKNEEGRAGLQEKAARPVEVLPEAAPPEVRASRPETDEKVAIPFWGEVYTSNMSLPVLTVMIAAMDAFNPCAFFVLFLLLGILVYTHSRKTMVLVGGIFVFFSGFIYFLFMSAWLNLFMLFGRIGIITSVAAIVALTVAVLNIKDFFFFKKGVSLVIPEGAKPRLFERMRNLLKKGSLPSMLTGTIVLAIAANSYELLCTAGFPMIYTRVLTLHGLPTPQYYLYLVFYNLIYMVPLAGIVVLCSVTLGARKFTERQGQVLKLISGLMMLCLGTVLLVEPRLLHNVFISAGLLLLSLAATGVIVLVKKKAARPDPQN